MLENIQELFHKIVSVRIKQGQRCDQIERLIEMRVEEAKFASEG